MKKSITLILTLLLVLGLCSSASAAPIPMGLSQTDISNLIDNGYQDYRDIGGLGGKTMKPTAGFTVQIDSQTQASYTGQLFDQTPSINMAAGQTASIVENTSPTSGSGRAIVNYDFQYRIFPDGQDRMSQPIVAQFFNSWSGVQGQFANALKQMEALNTNAELELYLNVSDGSDGNWSANGNSATAKKDTNFPNGIIWYFSGMVLDYKTGGPDFYPLPWGATVYQDSFQDCAMTYTADAGTAMNIPVSINNSGTQDITDMAATWYGTGWSNPVYTQSNLNIPQGGQQNILIPVTVPQIGQETRLVVLANVDGKTPADEANQDNNMMIIKVAPINPFADVSVTASANPTNPYNMENSMVTFVITNNGPGVADVTFSTGKNSGSGWSVYGGGTANYVLQPGENQVASYGTGGYPAGTTAYWAGVAEVTNTTDPDPGNNMARVQVTWKANQQPPHYLPSGGGPSGADASLIY
jgi:hypothetical protein